MVIFLWRTSFGSQVSLGLAERGWLVGGACCSGRVDWREANCCWRFVRCCALTLGRARRLAGRARAAYLAGERRSVGPISERRARSEAT